MGRRKIIDRPRKWTLHVPESTAARIEEILYDPLYHKPIYAARGRIINILLKEFIEDIEAGRRTFNPLSATLSRNLSRASPSGASAPEETEEE